MLECFVKKNSILFFALFVIFTLPGLIAKENITGRQVAAVPNGAFKDSEGFTAGVNAFLYNYGDGRIKPYNWSIAFSFKMSTRGMTSTYLFLDMPNFHKKDWRLQVYGEYKRYTFDDFYGLGNNPGYNKNVITPSTSEFISEKYFTFKQRWPSVRASLQIPSKGNHFKYIVGFGLANRRITPYEETNKLSIDQPLGIEGGVTSLLRSGLIFDTRDQQATPTSGIWTDLLAEYATSVIGSDYDYIRLTITDRRYFSLAPNLVYAQRVIFEPIWGDAPFYDKTIINSSYKPQQGLGGSTSLRGVPRLLFVGQHKLLANYELRYQLFNTEILAQKLAFYLHSFLDSGRVWKSKDDATLKNLRTSYGAGIHIRWNKDLIGAIDVGRSKYSSLAIYVSFENLF